MRVSCVSVRKKVVKFGRIMNEKNDWDNDVKEDAAERLVECI